MFSHVCPIISCSGHLIAFGATIVYAGKALIVLSVNKLIGKSYTCNVYRPGESQERFCIILEETKGQ